MPTDIKYCPDCGENKPQSDFYKSKNGSLGLAAYCKQCSNVRGQKARGTDGRKKEVFTEGIGRCGKCKELKPLHDFYVKKDGRHKTQCKACDNLLTRRYQSTADGKCNLWRAHMLRKYGLTPEQYQEMWRQQKGLCKICKTDLNNGVPNLDHCHTTGKARGILCHLCNCGLGYFRDRPELCIIAAEYLAEYAQGTT